MKPLVPVLWVVLAIGALVYWSNSADHHSQVATTAERDSDGDSADDPGTFHGDPCTVDCSGHEAGYQWAEKYEISDEDDCGSNSESFIEGCKAYVHEQHGLGDGDDDPEENPDSDD